MSIVFHWNRQFRFKSGYSISKNSKQKCLIPDHGLDQMSFRNRRHWPR